MLPNVFIFCPTITKLYMYYIYIYIFINNLFLSKCHIDVYKSPPVHHDIKQIFYFLCSGVKILVNTGIETARRF